MGFKSGGYGICRLKKMRWLYETDCAARSWAAFFAVIMD